MSNLTRLRSRFLAVLAALFLLTVFPAHVEAHLNSTGLGPVYDGLLHFLQSTEDLIPVLALALLAGQRGAGHSRRVLFVLPVAWFVGGLVGLRAQAAGSTALTCVSFLLLGGLLAADAKLSLRAITVLAAIVGLFHGYLNGAGMGRPASEGLVFLGLAFAVFVLVAIAAAFVVSLRRQWEHIAVRVVGSWVAASGLLMAGWALRRGA
jgi:hydrogenase/urease accessory protein HupE